MKKILTMLVLCTCFTATAQEKVKEVVQDDYQRNSLSIIVVDRGDNFDAQVLSGVRAIDLGDKFDMNYIPTDRIEFKVARTAAVGSLDISKAVGRYDLGKQIITYWFERKADGTMSADRMIHRGNYNADDQDVINAQATKVGPEALGDNGSALIGGSYVMVLDYSGIASKKNDDGEVTWSVTTNAHVYQIDYSQDTEAEVYAAWIYEDDAPETIAEKKAAYDRIEVGMKYKTTVSYTTSASEKNGGLKSAIVDGYGETLTRLEKQIPAWNVTTSIVSRRPLTAKVGKKEGLKNTMRFQAYKFKEDADGNLKSVPKGYLRATEIADNRGMASGNTKVSEFYQISGGRIEEGMLIKQKNDLGMGVSLGYKYNGLAPYNLSIDYLAHINTKGFAHYALLNVGVDVLTGSKIGEKYPGGDLATEGAGCTYLNLGIGYGFGIRAIRHIELVPFIMGGGDYMMNNNELLNSSNEAETEDSFMEKMAWFGNAGLRINFNVKYPLQLFVQADYTVLFKEGVTYQFYNDQWNQNTSYRGGNDKKLGHRNSFGIMAGVKWTF